MSLHHEAEMIITFHNEAQMWFIVAIIILTFVVNHLVSIFDILFHIRD